MNNILEATLQIKDAHNEGVTFHFLENIKEVLRDESGKVTGVKVITMELGESDESGTCSHLSMACGSSDISYLCFCFSRNCFLECHPHRTNECSPTIKREE